MLRSVLGGFSMVCLAVASLGAVAEKGDSPGFAGLALARPGEAARPGHTSTSLLREKKWQHLEGLEADDFLSSTVTAMESDPLGRVWVGTDRGLVWTDDNGRTWNFVNLAEARPISRRRRPTGRGAPATGRGGEVAGPISQAQGAEGFVARGGREARRGGVSSAPEGRVAGGGQVPAHDRRRILRRNFITSLARGRNGLWVGTLNGLCFGSEDLRVWYVYTPESGPFQAARTGEPASATDALSAAQRITPKTEGREFWTSPAGGSSSATDALAATQRVASRAEDREYPGPEIWSVAALDGEVWVSSSRGLFRSADAGVHWRRVEGTFPEPVTSITLAPYRGVRTCWLAGFDAPVRFGGAPDLLRSLDRGLTWSAFKTGTAVGLPRPVSARVNRLKLIGDRLWACTRHGLACSTDGGETWKKVTRRSGLTVRETFDIVRMGKKTLWVGTEEGLFSSRDGGDTWRREGRLRAPAVRLLPNGGFLWVSTNGGLLRRMRGEDCRTFGVRSEVLALARTVEYGTETWWAGTAGGLALSMDRGGSWRVLTLADGLPSNRILCLAGDGDRIWAGTDGGVWTATEAGQQGRRYDRDDGLLGLRVRDIAVAEGSVWAATNGGLSVLRPGTQEWRTFLPGKEWYKVAVCKGQVFGLVSGLDQAGGEVVLVRGDPQREDWRPCQLPGLTGGVVHQILALGDDVWVATDRGLYRSRDLGQTWSRFGSETLWATRVTRLAPGPDSPLWVQTVPSEPPSPTAFLNLTRDGGRSWKVLATAVPGHATAAMVLGDGMVVGTAHGAFVYSGLEQDLRPARPGWLAWNRIAAYAASTFRPDGLGRVSGVDPYAFHGPSLWLGSAEAGVVERGVPVLDDLTRTWDDLGRVPLDVTSFSRLAGEGLSCMASSPEGMWFGTANGLYVYDRLGSWRHMPVPADGSGPTPVRAVACLEDTVWVGTDSGLSVLNRSDMSWRRYTTENSPLPDDRVTCLASDGERIWGGTECGGFAVTLEGEWKTFLWEERITDVALGSTRVYFGTDRGVFGLERVGRVAARRRHAHKLNSPLERNEVIKVFVDGPVVWAATRDGVRKILYEPAEKPALTRPEPSARGPDGVLVVVNDEVPDSRRIGEEYVKARGIPGENLCRIRCPKGQSVSREVFERDIRQAIWRYLRDHDLNRKISCIVLTFGVPLRIEADSDDTDLPPARRRGASVDSELTLLARDHPLEGALVNPYLHREETFDSTRFGFYLVTRLDGPTPGSVRDLIRNAMREEDQRTFGSRGFARFDMHPLETALSRRFNDAIMSNYRFLRRQERLLGRVPPPEQTLLPYKRPGSCYNTFFYLGLGAREYRPEVFSWVRGAVGVCLDPVTAPSMHDTTGSWVAAAVEGGLTATIGNVADPGADEYLSVAHLYRYLQAGFTWAEAAYMSIPYLSWQTVVVGDPLYAPLR